MTTTLSPDERRRAMLALGIPRDKVDATLAGEIGTVKSGFLQVVGPSLMFPIRFTLPWSALISENRRFCAVGSRIRLTKEYRAAKRRIAEIAARAMTVEGTTFDPLKIPLALTARVYFPDNRIHDAPNFAGATHNALKGIVYADDVWLHRATWERAGVDVDHPRAELDIGPLPPLSASAHGRKDP